MQTVLKAHTFVGARRYDYDFDDKSDGRRVTGTTYYLAFVEEDPLGFPVEVKCANQRQHDDVVAAGFGAVFDVSCSVSARNNRVVYTADSITDTVGIAAVSEAS